jgi:hypothetical protein
MLPAFLVRFKVHLFIGVVKNMFRLREVFLPQPLMPPAVHSEHIDHKRYRFLFRWSQAAGNISNNWFRESCQSKIAVTICITYKNQ